jgi:hypothetical protein
MPTIRNNGAIENRPSDPKAVIADIARELRAHPEHWTQASFARDRLGIDVLSDDPNAVCWCLLGHVHKRVGRPPGNSPGEYDYAYYREILRLLADACCARVTVWNDEIGRTVEEVIALCVRVST